MQFTQFVSLLVPYYPCGATPIERETTRGSHGSWLDLPPPMLGWLSVLAFAFCSFLGSRSLAQSIPEGYEIIVIADDTLRNTSARLNNYGQVVWAKRLMDSDPSSQEIYLWEHGRTRRLTNNDRYDVLPQINDAGVIAWSGRTGAGASTYEIFRLSDGKLEQITADDRQDVLSGMNQAGNMVWYTLTPDGCSSSHLSVYEDGGVTIITDSYLRNDAAAINDTGSIVYNSRNLCVSPWLGSTRLLQGNSTVELAPWEPGGASLPSINNRGQVSWHLGGQGPGSLWENGTLEHITYEGRPLLNNRKQIAVFGKPHAGDPTGLWMLDSGQWHLLTTAFGVEQSNDQGELLLVFRPSGGSALSVSLAIMRRVGQPGDVDSDGDVDLHDAIIFQLCFSGTDMPHAIGCSPSDFDRDGDVDGLDVQMLTARMAGPRLPGDADYDGDVDSRDYVLMQHCTALDGTIAAPLCWSSDANYDGTVDRLDAALAFEHFSGPRD